MRKGAAERLPLFVCAGEGKVCRFVNPLIGFCISLVFNCEAQMSQSLHGQVNGVQPDAELDLRGVICPYNFVKTKLKLETMQEGQVLAVLLDAGDPIRNVPQSVSNEGHTVLAQEPVDQSFRVIIRRRGDE